MTSPPPGSAGSREGFPKWLLLLGGVCAGGYFLAQAVLLDGHLGLPLDDSWIHLQFARNLARGDGLSFWPGELVAGSTAPLWTALLSLLFWLPGNVVLWTQLAGIALYLAGGWALYRLARALDLGRGLASFAAALGLGTSWWVWSALSGMEVPLFILLSLLGVERHLSERRETERPPLALWILAAGALLRPEGFLLLVLALLDRLLVWRRDGRELRLVAPAWRPLLVGLGAALLLLLPALAFFALIGDSALPTTFGAKTAGSRGWSLDGRYLYVVLGILFRPQPILTLLAGAGALGLVARLGGPRDRGLLPALWVVGLPLAYSLLSHPAASPLVGNFGRYYFPLLPFVVLLGALGLEAVAERLGGLWLRGLRLPSGALLVALIALPTALDLVRGAGRFVQNVANVRDSDLRLAAWVNENLPPEAVLAVQDVGVMGFFTPNRLIDVAGLVTPRVQAAVTAAMTPDDPLGEAGMWRFLEAERPDYLVVYPAWYPGLTGDPARLTPMLGFDIPNNITMGGDRLVMYATPWTRFSLPPAR